MVGLVVCLWKLTRNVIQAPIARAKCEHAIFLEKNSVGLILSMKRVTSVLQASNEMWTSCVIVGTTQRQCTY